MSAVLASGQQIGMSIGGTTRRLVIAGVPVFAKGIRLTDLESSAIATGSTANMFALPVVCHYGIGSPGFGVWRELAAHVQTSELVLTGTGPSFPLMYHWRILPCDSLPLPDQLRDVDAAVRFWDGSDAVRDRITALGGASQLVWVFMELLDATLDAWLTDQMRSGPAALSAACDLVEAQLHGGIDAMAAAGLLHLDLHFHNIVTDGPQLCFADLGLAMSDRFDLDPAERMFAAEHRDYDRSYAFTHLLRWLNRNLLGTDVPPRAADLIRRYTPIAGTLTPFYVDIQSRTRRARYPRVEEQRAWSATAH